MTSGYSPLINIKSKDQLYLLDWILIMSVKHLFFTLIVRKNNAPYILSPSVPGGTQRHLVTVTLGCSSDHLAINGIECIMQSLGDPDSISIINLLSSHAAGCAREQTVSISSTKFIVALP